jgi:pantoate--beta-alanine ligase
MYKQDEILLKAPKIKGFILEGEKRAGHFDGMLQIVLKLLCLVNPTNSYFGKKDAQQLYLIEQLKDNFYLKTNIIACEIIRENDGLAMSSRNIYLTKQERVDASFISSSLNIAYKLIIANNLKVDDIIKAMKLYLDKSNLIQVEYICIVDRKFNLIDTVDVRNSIILIAVKIGNTRLIDNIWI